MRIGWIVFFLACTTPEVLEWSPEDPWTWQNVAEPKVFSDGFLEPFGLAVADDVVWVADEGTGSVTGLGPSGSIDHEWVTEFSPRHVAAGGGWLVATETDEVGVVSAYQVESGVAQVLESGRKWGDVVYSQGQFWWYADAGEKLYSWTPGDAQPIERALSGPILTLAAFPEGVMVATGAKQPWNIRNQEDALVAEIWEEPQELTWAKETLWVSTRSPRWPFPGWIYRLEDGVAKVVEYSPPEPGPIAATSEYIYWGSKQTLTRAALGAEAYEAIALQTSVADVVADGETIFWTDRQRGLVLNWDD